MSKPKIFIVTTVPDTLDFILRGQPNYLSGFYDVTIVSSKGSILAELALKENVSHRVVPMVRGVNPFYDLYSIFWMCFILMVARPDIIHSYTPKAGLVSSLAGWICRIPIRVHTFTGLIWPTSGGAKRRMLIAVDKLICFCATKIIPESNGVKNDLQRANITSKEMFIIGDGNIAGVDTKYFSLDNLDVLPQTKALRLKLGLTIEDFVYCYVGRLNRDKGVDELVKSFRGISAYSHLLIVGGLDERDAVGNETLELIDNHPNIHRLGILADIRPALAVSNVFVLPSYREGFPNVLLQAGAMGLPALVTDVSGSNELIEPNVNGWIVPPRDACRLEFAMLEARNLHPDYLKEMGKKARFKVERYYEQQDHWRRVRAFYEDLLSY